MKNTSASTRKKPSSYKQKRREEQARRKRLLIIGGIALAAIVIAIILIVVSQPPPPVGAFETVPTQSWVGANDSALGPANAKVVLKEFADFQCPICKEYNNSVWPQLYKDYVATGKVRYEYHHYLVIDINTGGSESHQAALASECAADQNRFWDMAEMLFANQQGEASGAFINTRLKAFAKALGLDTGKFNACFDSSADMSKVNADMAMANQLGLTGTPSLLINGVLVQNPLDYNAVKTAIDAAIQKAGQ